MIFLGLFSLVILILPVFLKAFVVGYHGWVKVVNSALPVRSCNVDKKLAPQIGDALIHGSSGDNAASPINWAEGHLEYNGTIETDFFQSFWTAILRDWAVTARDTAKSLIWSPTDVAKNTYTYTDSYVTTLTLTGTYQGLVTMSIGVAAKTRTLAGSGPSFAPGTLNEAPVPYWKSAFEGTGWGFDFGGSSADVQVTAWTVTINNNTIIQHTFDGSQDPHFIEQSLLNVNGSVTLYDEDGVSEPSSGGSALIKIAGSTFIELPYIVVTDITYGTATPTTKVVRPIPFRALGTATKACCIASTL